MMKSLKFIFLVVLVCLVVSCDFFMGDKSSRPTHTSISKTTVENFTLLDQRGKSHELYQYSDWEAVILISQGNGCPIVRQSIPHINQLKKDFETKGVKILMINASPQDDRSSIAREVDEHGIEVPVLHDSSQAVVKALGMTRTAHAIMVDPRDDWAVMYNGAVYGQLEHEAAQKEIKRRYLRDAVETLFNFQPIIASKTKVRGRLIKFKSNGE